MRTISVRVDDYVYEALSERARRCGLSLYKYVQQLLKEVATSPPNEDIVEKIEKVSEWVRGAHGYYDDFERIAKELREIAKRLDDALANFDFVMAEAENELEEIKRRLLTQVCKR
jgi:esterase/lipase